MLWSRVHSPWPGSLGGLLAALPVLILIPPALGRAAPVPSVAGQRVHMVAAGDTLWSIAARHDTSVEAIARANRLKSIHRLRAGQVLRLPGPPAGGRRAAGVPAVRSRFVWPSRGVVTSRFGYRGRRHHHGIDIAAPAGTPITAARDGVVRFAGWMNGYGRLVIVDHGAGMATWYGHASTIVTRVGRRVRRGQLIARVGRTGDATGSNLHFEVRQDNRPLDPLAFLRKDAR